MTTVPVKLGSEAYDVLIGPAEAGLDRIQELARGASPILVSEPRVFGLHGQLIADRLGADPVLIPEGEAAKDWGILHQLLADLADRCVTRSTPIIALGGGSVGDVAGLAASLFKRGCRVVHVRASLHRALAGQLRRPRIQVRAARRQARQYRSQAASSALRD